MRQPCGHVSFLNRCIEVFFFPADHTGNEVCEIVIIGRWRGWTGLLVFSHPAPVTAIGTIDGQVPLGSIENVPHSVVTSLLGAQSTMSCFRRGFCSFAAHSDSSLVVRVPMANFELQQRAFPIRVVVLERTVQGVRSLLVIIEHEVAADRRYLVGESQAQSPSRDVQLMNALV